MNERKVKKEIEKEIQVAQKNLNFERAHYLDKKIKEMEANKRCSAIWQK